MKNTISTLTLALLVTTIGFSQTEKGNFIIGGASNLSVMANKSKIKSNNQEQDGETSFNFSFGPDFGYFAINNLAIGLQLPISFSRNNFDYFNEYDFVDTITNKTTSIVVAPFVRYYFSKNNIKPFLQGSVGFGGSKSKFSASMDDSESKATIFKYGLDGGVAIFVNPQISIDLGIGYRSTTNKPKDSSSDLKFINNTFGFNTGIHIFI